MVLVVGRSARSWFDNLSMFADNVKGARILEMEVLVEVDIGYCRQGSGFVEPPLGVCAGASSRLLGRVDRG